MISHVINDNAFTINYTHNHVITNANRVNQQTLVDVD